jgi:hypothetical protein
MEGPGVIRAQMLQNVPTPVLAEIQNTAAMRKVLFILINNK